MTTHQNLEQPAKGDAGASPAAFIDHVRLQDTLKQTWGPQADKLPKPADTASAHLNGMLQVAENKSGQATKSDAGSSEQLAMAARSKSDDSAEPAIVKALIAEAQKAHEGKLNYMPHSGARYTRHDVPDYLACAAAMSQVMISAHKDIGAPLNYNRFYEVGVQKFKDLFTHAGLVSPVHGPRQSGDFIIASGNPRTEHPHIGLLARENGTLMVYHNQSGTMVKEPLSESKFVHGYRHTEYLRPR